MGSSMGEQTLRSLWPHVEEARPGLLAAIADAAPIVFPKYGLTSPLTVAHAMAQFSEEIGADMPPNRIEFEENLNYTAAGIARTWPSRFSTTSAIPYAHNPRKLADAVYGGRMGNAPSPSDDGYNFRGRGGSQVTGREGYQKLAKQTDLDLLGNPRLVNDPAHFLECAVADFVLCGCLPFAEKDDVRGVTHHLNGGYIGLAEREKWLARWKTALGADNAPATVPGPAPGVLTLGSRGFEVKAAQERLIELAYPLGEADGVYGNKTRDAVLAFQADRGLLLTGQIDEATREALSVDLSRPTVEERSNATADDLREKGSQTIKNADGAATAAKAGGVAAGAGAAAQEGWFDKLGDELQKWGGPKEALDAIKPLAEWLSAHWWVALLIVCAVVIYYAKGVIRERVDDHRTGANLGR